MKKFAAFGFLLFLSSAASAAMASPETVVQSAPRDIGHNQVVVLQQGHIAKEQIKQVAPANLDHSTLADPRLDGNVGTTGATSATGAMSAPGI